MKMTIKIIEGKMTDSLKFKLSSVLIVYTNIT